MPPKSPKPAPPENAIIINIKLTEIGNVNGSNYSGLFNIKAEFNENPLTSMEDYIFEVCTCSPSDSLNYVFKLKLPQIGEEEIFSLSTKPIVIILLTFEQPKGDEKIDKPSSTNIKGKIVGYFPIFISKMLSVKPVNLTGTQEISFEEPRIYSEIITWPNTPYICYDIKSVTPLLTEKKELKDHNISEPIIEIPFTNLSITFELIININEEFLKNCTYEMAMNFPVDKKFKTIKIPNGEVRSIKKIDKYKIYNNLIDFPSCTKYSQIPTNLNFNNIDEFVIPSENCKLNDTIISDPVINFQQIVQLKITKDMIKKFINYDNVTIELLITSKVDDTSKHYIGVIDVSMFKLVGIKNLRYIIPLQKFERNILALYLPNEQAIIRSQPQSAGPTQLKTQSPAAAQKKVQNSSGPEYLLNSKNLNGCVLPLNTCVIVNIEVDKPYLPRIKESFFDNECRILELKPKIDENIMNLNIKKIIKNFIENYDCTRNTKNNIICNNNETTIYSMFNKITMNYIWNMNSPARAKDLLEDIYILLTNKIHDSFNDGIPDLNTSDPKYRLKCAIECLELGFNDEAQDFYTMNILDGNNPSDYYVDYAIHSLFVCDMAMAQVCCDEAIKINPKTYSAYLIQAYIKFFAKDYNSAEDILINLTTACNSFVEGWMALLILYLSEDQKTQVRLIVAQINQFLPNNYCKSVEKYVCHLHNRDELLWNNKSIENLNDPKLIAIRLFIQWGCLQFAEVGLGFIIHHYGCDSYEYLYHMALVDYYRKDYTSALQRCTLIKCINPNITVDKKNLIVQCLLEMQSLQAIYELKRIKNPSNNNKTCIDYLIYLKIGRMYMNSKKYNTAIYYWKQCCYRMSTYSCFKLLGLVSLKAPQLNLSQICFQKAYRINPFNLVSWGNLAIINYRKKRIEQFRMYADLAKQQPGLDEKLLEKIELIEESLNLEQQTK